MHLPGLLSSTTLGDLLGVLHRGRATGLLRLTERYGATAGRVHDIRLSFGLVAGVETAAHGAARTGTSKDAWRLRLEGLFALADARVSFHVARPGSGLGMPLLVQEFLHGRPRKRDGREQTKRSPSLRQQDAQDSRAAALRTLGLPAGVSESEIKRAFRALAREHHPDCAPASAAHFARLSTAYHTLMDSVERA